MSLAWMALLMLCSLSTLSAQRQEMNPLQGIKSTSQTVVTRHGDKALVDFTLDLTEMTRLNSNTVLEVTPVLQSNADSNQLALPPILISGRTRAIMLRRKSIEADIIRSKHREQSYQYTIEVPFALWMKDASCLLRAKSSGCAECDLGDYTASLTPNALAPLYQPTYRYAMLVPEGEETKRREESLTAMITFPVNKTNLNLNLGNNRAEVKRIDNKLQELTTNSALTVDALSLTGYASPEGSADLNQRLSEGRVESIAAYLVRTYPRFKNHYTSRAMGADWDGLRAAIEESSVDYKEQILQILQERPASERTAALRAIDNGKTYAHLLQTYYPPLRRTVITFSFVVKGFDLTEAKEVIKKHPTHLSLAEVNLVANSYPAGSAERYETWAIAADAFPNAVEPATNAAIMDFEAGRYAQAVKLLERYKKNTKLYTILGIAYAYNGQYDDARTYLTKAAQLGLPDAQYNLDEFLHYMQDNF
ncbi:tetratricopeptide repeat protein [Porphyromonas uenonis 60-3]|uniref:Tetratricopeptide repeat protein n=2 Tax=Porphyromonas uenonis TaxID=281920 RepID=C2MDI9_9PORP|nr:tetratricopeptide repeat protein [Porphyromonas uenonis 60-3]